MFCKQGIIPYMIEKLADFGDTKELRNQLKQLEMEKQLSKDTTGSLRETIEKLRIENNSLKSIFREILSAEDRKAIIKEIFEDKKDDLEIDFEKLIKDEMKNYIEDAIKEKYRSEDEW